MAIDSPPVVTVPATGLQQPAILGAIAGGNLAQQAYNTAITTAQSLGASQTDIQNLRNYLDAVIVAALNASIDVTFAAVKAALAAASSSVAFNGQGITGCPSLDRSGTGPLVIGAAADGVQIGKSAGTLGLYGATPHTRPVATGVSGQTVAGAGAAILVDSQNTGGSGATAYTMGDIVLALKQVGILGA